MSKSAPIGLFDSGVGGLTVLREVKRQLPRESTIYFADTARVPYGSRTRKEILQFNFEIISFLVEQGAKMVIMACGTSSSLVLPTMQKSFKIPLVGLIEPGARTAVTANRNGRIGVIATERTAKSKSHQKAINNLEKKKVISIGCPKLVPLVEAGLLEDEETKEALMEYLSSLQKRKVDSLILGCTHYPHLSKLIRSIMGRKVTLIDPAKATVAEARKLLAEKKMLSSGKVKARYFTSGSPAIFQELGSKLLGEEIKEVQHIALGEGRK